MAGDQLDNGSNVTFEICPAKDERGSVIGYATELVSGWWWLLSLYFFFSGCEKESKGFEFQNGGAAILTWR